MLVTRSALAALMAASIAVAVPAAAHQIPAAPAQAATAGSFELVGQEPLGNRGMNAALAVHGNYAYVGSRTDGKPWGTTQNLNHAGIMVVNVTNPAAPAVVGEIGPPNEAIEDITSREMRIWHRKEVLIVLNLALNCSEAIHMCSPRANASGPDNFKFYDISGTKAAAPELIASYTPTSSPHEFFLWEDPLNPDRALLFYSVPSPRKMVVVDISKVRQTPSTFTQIGSFGPFLTPYGLHSFSISNDGKRGYLAHLEGGFAIVDTSDIAKGLPNPAVRNITPNANRVSWPGPGAHSAVKLWKRDWVIVGDEVYGDALMPPLFTPAHGCPWGWDRMIDISDPTKPKVVAEYKLPQNQAAFCDTDAPRPFSSYAAHNPTLTPNIALQSWHSGGLQAIGLDDPANPVQLAEYKPAPLPAVVQEDPVLSAGQDKVVVWSFPIVQNGLIYVTDVRNGLYILRYNGPHEEEIDTATFLEGNSNQGHALCFEPVLKPKANPGDPDEYLIPEYCNQA